MDPKGNKIMQQVEYEWKPPFYKVCNRVGHECDLNKPKPKPKKQCEQVKQMRQEH